MSSIQKSGTAKYDGRYARLVLEDGQTSEEVARALSRALNQIPGMAGTVSGRFVTVLEDPSWSTSNS